jgi:TRAP-type mannitol/chloroaromatic compound transport system permease large subunit
LYCALGVLLFSLTFIQRSREGWKAHDDYLVSADRVAVGLPLPWIGWTTLRVTRGEGFLDELPEERQWKPGVYFDARRFVFAPAFALALAAAILFAVTWSRARMRKYQSMPTRTSVIAVVLGSAAIGTLVPTDPVQIGLALAVALIVGIVAATWNRPRAITVASFVVVAMLTLWWVQRMTSYFWTRLRPVEGFRWRDDLLAPVLLATFGFLVVMGVHVARRLVMRLSSRASTPAS